MHVNHWPCTDLVPSDTKLRKRTEPPHTIRYKSLLISTRRLTRPDFERVETAEEESLLYGSLQVVHVGRFPISVLVWESKDWKVFGRGEACSVLHTITFTIHMEYSVR